MWFYDKLLVTNYIKIKHLWVFWLNCLLYADTTLLGVVFMLTLFICQCLVAKT